MGRHESDPVPLMDLFKDTGPMKRIRDESPTEQLPAIEFERTKRRVWPVAVLLAVSLSAAVGIPVALSSATPDRPVFVPSPLPTEPDETEPEPVPTATVTEKEIRYKTTPGPTVRVTLPPSPVPGPTITVTKTPKPKPAVTVRVTEHADPRCFRFDDDLTEVEILCP